MTKLSDREWTVLGVLWDLDGAALGEVTQALKSSTGWSRNTVLTYLTRMEAKGLVHCTVEGRARHYTPNLQRDRAVRGETRSFLDKVYRGSVGLMVSALAEDKALSKAEIDELYEILRKAEEGQR